MTKRALRHNALVPSPTPPGPVYFHVVHHVGDQALAEVGVNYSKAEVPDRAYYADWVDVRKGRSGIALLFGKLNAGTSQLRTQLEVIFPDDMFLRQLWGTTRNVHETLVKARRGWRLDSVGEVEDTDKIQTFRSNNAFIGTWGDEAVIDFYYLSPRDFYHVSTQQKKQVGLEPVVRIVLYPGLLLEFFEKCGPFAAELESAQPEEIRS